MPAQPPCSVAVLLLQPECNMSCTFCATEDALESMGLEQALALLDRLAAEGVSSVVLGGGEPFEWPGDVLRLAAAARARGLSVQVGTNGIALPAGFAELACVDRWVLPLESVDAATHQELRRFEHRHHALILERLRELQRARKSVTISTVVTARNVRGLPDLARFLREYQAAGGNLHAWHLYRFLPVGRGGRRNHSALELSEPDYRAACAGVQALGLSFQVFRRSDMYRSRTVRFFWSQAGRIVSDPEAVPAP
jgi:MoaA/NifB/PqqE/SkfB family radical SAM enzyme